MKLGILVRGFLLIFRCYVLEFTSVESQHLATIQINTEMGKQRNKHDSNQNPFYQYQNRIDSKQIWPATHACNMSNTQNSMYLSHLNRIQWFFSIIVVLLLEICNTCACHKINACGIVVSLRSDCKIVSKLSGIVTYLLYENSFKRPSLSIGRISNIFQFTLEMFTVLVGGLEIEIWCDWWNRFRYCKISL